KAPLFAVAFAPDGKTLASASGARGNPGLQDGVKLWDLGKQKVRATLEHPAGVFAVAFAPDGKTLATGCCDKTVRLWQVATGRKLGEFSGHTSYVWSVVFAPAGKSLASADEAGRVIQWNLATGKPLRQWQFPGPVYGIAFARDSRHLATANGNSTVYILRLAAPGKKGRSEDTWRKQVAALPAEK